MAHTKHKKIKLNWVNASPLPEWKPLLLRWQRIMRSFAKHWAQHSSKDSDRDVAWWYRERTAVGFFAGAIWKSRGEAIEEYPTEKKHRTRKGRNTKRLGRGDLMFSFKKQWYVAEAKLREPSLMGIQYHKKARYHLRKARRDSVKSPSYRGWAQRVGMLFLVPYSLAHPSAQIIRQWLADLKKLKKKTAMAWTFPRVASNIKWKEKSNGKFYYCPGIALLVRPPRARNNKSSR